MKRRILFLLLLLLTVLLASLALANVQEGCAHEWVAFDAAEHGYQPEEVQFEPGDDDHHWCSISAPERVCALCEEREYAEALQSVQNRHAYLVKTWEVQQEEGMVSVTWACSTCAYERTETLALSMVLEGTGETCLHGGACEPTHVGYMYADGCIYDSGVTVLADMSKPDESFRLFYDALLVEPGETGGVLTLVSRTYCSLCGRPSAWKTAGPTADFADGWNGLPAYTENVYLQMEMPENLPYQLIDLIRKDFGAA